MQFYTYYILLYHHISGRFFYRCRWWFFWSKASGFGSARPRRGSRGDGGIHQQGGTEWDLMGFNGEWMVNYWDSVGIYWDFMEIHVIYIYIAINTIFWVYPVLVTWRTWWISSMDWEVPHFQTNPFSWDKKNGFANGIWWGLLPGSMGFKVR